VAHRHFESIIVIICVASSVILALDDASLVRGSPKAIVLRNLDASFTAVFGLEVCVCVCVCVCVGGWVGGWVGALLRAALLLLDKRISSCCTLTDW